MIIDGDRDSDRDGDVPVMMAGVSKLRLDMQRGDFFAISSLSSASSSYSQIFNFCTTQENLI